MSAAPAPPSDTETEDLSLRVVKFPKEASGPTPLGRRPREW